MGVERKGLFNRREFIKAAGFAGLFLGAREIFKGRPAYAAEAVPEVSPVEPALEMQQQPAALQEAMRLFEANLLDTSIPIGWIDTTPLFAELPYFTGDSGCVIDVDQSRAISEVDPFTSEVLHAAWALQFAVQASSVTPDSFLSPGLSQAEWTKIVCIPDNNSSLVAYAERIRRLVDSGVGVIGSMPTWTEADGVTDEDVVAVSEAFTYAAEHNVLIVLPAGNRGVDMANPPEGNRRILHDLKLQHPNVLCAGGISNTSELARWGANNEKGSNYGKGFITVVSPILSRHVPEKWDQVADGTTFATGDLVGCIQLIQARIGRDANGALPDHARVAACITETAHGLGDRDQFGNGILQMYGALIAADGVRRMLRE